ncbi:hypothetical protein DPMN_143955 [Dreissena polymorpha]|uniref:Uncharacterized protein n=1 Tax=Dreissena polymorpha TaxID=45954 RepID=A0A9D4GK48_DREPO|nr:hypothetical protein DPMN_143955 [Dreissena polymorpha]
MNEPQQVDSDGEIYFRYRPRSAGCEGERSEITGDGSRQCLAAELTESSGIAEDETSGSSTMATEGAVVTNLTGDGSLQKTVAEMAAILKDVVSELKILKGSGISDARSAECNYNHNKTPAIHIDTPSPEYAVSDVCANVPQRVQKMQPMYHRDGRYTDETGYAEYQQVPNREHA